MALRLRTSDPLELALRYTGGSHTVADIAAAVAMGELQRWDGDESVVVTEIKQTPQQRILLFFLAAGNMTELQAMAPPILEWGKQHGCVKAQLIGRQGWQRSWLLRDNWKPVAVMMERDL